MTRYILLLIINIGLFVNSELSIAQADKNTDFTKKYKSAKKRLTKHKTKRTKFKPSKDAVMTDNVKSAQTTNQTPKRNVTMGKKLQRQKARNKEFTTLDKGNTLHPEEQRNLEEFRNFQYTRDIFPANTLHPSERKRNNEYKNFLITEDIFPAVVETRKDKNKRQKNLNTKYTSFEGEERTELRKDKNKRQEKLNKTYTSSEIGHTMAKKDQLKMEKKANKEQTNYTLKIKLPKRPKDSHPSAEVNGMEKSRSLKASRRYRKRKLFFNRLFDSKKKNIPNYAEKRRKKKPKYSEKEIEMWERFNNSRDLDNSYYGPGDGENGY